MENKIHSLKFNMVLNAIRGIMGVIFPLITFPYASKILGVENIGKYSYANSIINYFVLFAGLGISTYAIREGARIRHDKEKIGIFVRQMFSLNIITTLISYLALIFLIFRIADFYTYRAVLLILSLQIIFKTLSVEWLFSIFEDYLYITIRSIGFQLVSLIAMFIFVKDEKSLLAYTAVTVLGSIGTGIANFVYSKKYIKISLIRPIDWRHHLKPILVLFSLSVATTIYVSSDTTMLGIMCGDYTTGIYAVASKVYTILKTLLSSILVVAIPRLSALLGESDKKKFCLVAKDVLETLLTFVLPAITGIIFLNREIILLIAGEEFMASASPLVILSIALAFCCCAWFWSQCILIPHKKENIVLFATIISAVINVVINIICIPIWRENAAALSTVVAELISLIVCYVYGRKEIRMIGLVKTIFKIIIGCIAIIAYIQFLKSFTLHYWVRIIISIAGAIPLYFIIEITFKNNAINSIWKKVLKRFGARQ